MYVFFLFTSNSDGVAMHSNDVCFQITNRNEKKTKSFEKGYWFGSKLISKIL